MIFYGNSLAAQGIERTNFVLDFLKSAFDFPTGRVEFDHLFGGKRQVGGDQRKTKTFAVNKNDFNLALQSLGRADKFGKSYIAFFAVKVDSGGTGLISQLCRKFFDRSKTVPVFGTPAVLSFDNDRKIIEHSVDSQAAEYMNRNPTMISYFSEQGKRTEPAVANNQSGMLEAFNKRNNKFRANTGFCLEPLCVGKLDFLTVFLRQRSVKLLNQRQASPATMDKKQQSGDYPAMTENIFGTVGFGGMVEMNRATGNMLAGFSVSGVVKRQQQSAVNRWVPDQKRDKAMESFPRQLRGVDEIVEALERDVSSQKHGETAKDIADPSGLTTACQCNNDGFENIPAVVGDEFGGLIEKRIEFHVRLLGLNCEHEVI